MSNLNIPEINGNAEPAAQIQTNGKDFGQAVAKPAAPAQAGDGTFGDASGAMAIGKAISNAGDVLANLNANEQKITTINEAAQRKLQQAEWQQAALKAKAGVQQVAQIQGNLSADDMQQLYQQNLQAELDNVNKKYNYTTYVGNDIAQASEDFQSGANLEYQANDVYKQRAQDNFALQNKIIDTNSSNLEQQYALNGFDASTLKQNVDAVLAPTYTPEFVIGAGGEAAADQKRQALRNQIYDRILNQLPATARQQLLRNHVEGGTPGEGTAPVADDPLEGMDKLVAKQLLSDTDREVHYEELKAKQVQQDVWDKNTTALIFKLDDMSHKPGVTMNDYMAMQKQVQTMYQNGQLGDSQVSRLYSAFDAQRDALLKKQEAAANKAAAEQARLAPHLAVVTNSISTGMKLEPRQNQKDVDIYYEKVTQPNIAQLPYDQQAQKVAEFSAKTGVTPTPWVNLATGNIISGDPNRVAAGVNLARQLNNSNPNFYHQLPENARIIYDSVNSGVSPQNAIQVAAGVAKQTDSDKAYYRKQADDYLNPNTGKGTTALTSAFGTHPGWSHQNPIDKDLPGPLVSQYNNLVRDYTIVHQGNTTAAAQAAVQTLQKSWAVTNVDGSTRWMQNAPEAQYPNTPPDLLKNQLQSQMNSAGVKDYRIFYGGIAKNGQPYYLVNQFNPTTNMYDRPVVGSDGQTYRYQFNVTTTPEYVKAQQDQAKQMDDAQQARNQQLKGFTPRSKPNQNQQTPWGYTYDSSGFLPRN
ncbi:MAG: hypothetical protein ACYCZQ_03260 [Burkholderiales bacterium]